MTSLLWGALLALMFPLAVSPARADETPPPRPVVKERVTGMELVSVPGGCYRAGGANATSDALPVHEVCVSPFHLAKYEVTQGEWRRVMGNNPSLFNRCGDDCPVDHVSWSDAQAFISRMNSLTGLTFRLPTEAEWEYACRGGGRDDVYCGGNDSAAVAWTSQNSSGTVHPVGQKKPNVLGLYDMSGNVWEWVQDWHASYPANRQTDPSGPADGSSRVRRGGSWQYAPPKARAAWRSSGYQDDRAMDIGFRVALPAGQPPASR
jgi:formylglycine-generating enzyme required for sulfatase activity